MHRIQNELLKVYSILRKSHSFGSSWPEGNWPIRGGFTPPEFEIVLGAVLTQNTRWENAERCLRGLSEAGLGSAHRIGECTVPVLEELLRSVGFFRKKAKVVKRLAGLILEWPGDFYSGVGRDQLLSIDGVGPETADAILLYACNKPEFVADAYARRILGRNGLLEGNGYGEAKRCVEAHLPQRVPLYQSFHALLVEHAKKSCRKSPVCSSCVLRSRCPTAQ